MSESFEGILQLPKRSGEVPHVQEAKPERIRELSCQGSATRRSAPRARQSHWRAQDLRIDAQAPPPPRTWNGSYRVFNGHVEQRQVLYSLQCRGQEDGPDGTSSR